ncbi:MAG TPA: Swt1 family HEPN domain-containing protein [Candidatus Acidoferrum sp.]|nr:Swt1 family HEPN domain-containing protein [Candidatus Acidoferrum sp.]
MSDASTSNRLKLFAASNLALESELLKLERLGINTGRSQLLKKQEVVDTDLFEAEILSKARKMADFYVLYYCIENTIRKLISERMLEKYHAEWWTTKVPEKVRDEVKERQEKEKDTPMSIRSTDPLAYTTFGELIDILNSNWSDFADTIRSQRAMQRILSELNSLRGIIAHSADLSDDDIARFQLLVKDWLRIQT